MNIKFRRVFSLLIISLLTYKNAFAVPLPNQEPVPGGIVKINLNIVADSSNVLPQAYFQEKKLLVYPSSGNYFALVGIPLKLKPGSYEIKYIDHNGNSKAKSFIVKNKKYNISRIKIKNNNMVNPDPKTQEKIISDITNINSAVNNYTQDLPHSLILRQPVSGIPTTSFGARRIINDQVKDPHTGMDIAAAALTPVYAAADGKVVLADNFYLPGNVVALDHGRGLVTMYAHLSEILVKPGETIKMGELLGKVGSTGRVTGPHLHWTVRLNETPVNPDLFLEKRQITS